MAGDQKIIGMWQNRDNETGEESPDNTNETERDELVLDESEVSEIPEDQVVESHSEDEDWTHYADETETGTTRRGIWAPITLGVAAATWTGFFLWANRDIFATVPTPKGGIDLIVQWCLPIATLGILYLLYMRNSTREVSRFAEAGSALRAESELLEQRLKTVNNELSVAREFLNQESRELEFLGEQSSGKLTSAAKLIKSSLEDGLGNMAKLDEVGNSAFQNLEHLREHLPVVISTAKDVTNQIGNAGRTAQTEMSAMVTTLKKIGETGTAAKRSLDQLSEKSAESLDQLQQTAENIQRDLTMQLEETETGTTRLANILKQAADDTRKAIAETRTTLTSDGAEASSALREDLEALENRLVSVGEVTESSEERLKQLSEQLQEKVSEITDTMATLDNEGGEKTAKLAFAMTAMEQNSAELQQRLESGYGVADGMIERMEKLLEALDSSAREMDETLPAAFDRVSKGSEESLALYGRIAEEAEKAKASASAINDQISGTEQAITLQQNRLGKLREDGEAMSANVTEQIDKISLAITQVREENEALAQSAGEKLISALLRVKETAKQASEHSREALEDSISGSAEKFEQISEETLNRIIDEKIASIAPKLEEAVASAVQTTDRTADHLTQQLNAIEEMTTSLEQRILFAKEKAEQSSEENFTRRVALLTESLNSIAIDVGKVLSNDVTDTEWAAYLKGDRGIFARRAVRLLDSGEARAILTHYSSDDEFREHVNRYIHDFEAMLRGVLSTRDGSAISVTLLSSDIGKLYVALAQSIERLRS